MGDSEVFVYLTVFIDETGSDARSKLRKYGQYYSIRGIPAKNQTLLVQGERIAAIACISTAGLVDVKPYMEQQMVMCSTGSYRLSSYLIYYLTMESIHIL